MSQVSASLQPCKNDGQLSAEKIWSECLKLIKENTTSLSYKTWFEPIKPIKFINNELTVQVPSQFFYDWVEEHYGSLIQKVICSVIGEEAKLFYLIQPDEMFSHDLPNLTLVQPITNPDPVRKPFTPHINLREENILSIKSNLNSRYTFDNFIKGDCNQLARAAALAVANNPGGTSFNPLVIYGGTGLGKTHLLHALGNHSEANGKARRILYVSSEKFTIDFIEAVQSDSVNDFSLLYKSIDLLIVDDIQFFAGKEKTQDNFFHIFNTLYHSGKQVVLSSDVPPKELKGLDERLISRFQSGLIADIQPPDLETRIAILRKKSEENQLELPQDVVEFIAVNVTSNVRELEGCLISLLARASLENREITVDLARDVLRVVVQNIRTPITIEHIQKAVSQYFDIPLDLLRGKSRRQEIVHARQIAMYLAKELTNSSLKTIGLHFGGRDHSTVIHACQTVDEIIRSSEEEKQHIQSIRKIIELQS
ncbi:MAG: chromosomal replication initiator protein DnaA [Bacteroidetes bacterium]|nr:chromosomal replication initiator protein DnaA [Bacteroidota bacterium]